MSWTLTGSVAEYLDAAGDFLRADPVRHTVELTVTAELAAAGPAVPGAEPPVFGWWRPDGGAVTAAAFQTPPFPLLLTPGQAGPAGTRRCARSRPRWPAGSGGWKA